MSSICILLLIQRLPSDNCQGRKGVDVIVQEPLKELGVLPKVLYFIRFVHLNPNFGYQVIKEARFFLKKNIFVHPTLRHYIFMKVFFGIPKSSPGPPGLSEGGH